MVIAIDIRPLLETEQTGVSVYTKELIDELVKNKNHQFILFYNSWTKKIDDIWQQSNVMVRSFRWPSKILNITETLFNEPAFDDLIPEADYFLFPNLNFLSVRHKPYGVVIHDISFERYPEFFNWKSRLWHRAINVKEKLHAARDIFAVSNYTASDVAEFYSLPEEKIIVAYPGITSVAASAIAKQSNPYFLFLGRIEARKNVRAIIQAFIQIKDSKKCADYMLILAGPAARDSAYGKKVLTMIDGRSDIKIVGFTTDAEKNNLLANAAALVYPSFYEGFGFPPLEAQALNVPVVTSSFSSLPEIIGDSGLLINPDSIDELAWAMNEAVSNEATKKMLIARGMENVKRFNWQTTAQIILSRIEKII